MARLKAWVQFQLRFQWKWLVDPCLLLFPLPGPLAGATSPHPRSLSTQPSGSTTPCLHYRLRLPSWPAAAARWHSCRDKPRRTTQRRGRFLSGRHVLAATCYNLLANPAVLLLVVLRAYAPFVTVCLKPLVLAAADSSQLADAHRCPLSSPERRWTTAWAPSLPCALTSLHLPACHVRLSALRSGLQAGCHPAVQPPHPSSMARVLQLAQHMNTARKL